MESSYKNDFTSKQRAVGELFYVFVVIACIVSITGLVWSIFDFIMPLGKLDLFLALSLGYQIAIVAGFAAGLFFLLIFFFGLFKKGRKLITRYIFKVKEIEERYKNRLDVKIAAGGLLISILVIIVGVLIALIQDVLPGSSSTSPFAEFLSSFSGGNWVLFSGVALFAVLSIALFTIYFWKNGYYVILKIMGVLERED
jgi:sterol desaturase/sphingolipid hydroxylase (fatty acid hydroxylase superfamily)